MGLIDSLISRISSSGVITLKERLSSTAYHVRFESDALADARYVPGNFLRIHCGMGQVRSYSVWNFDKTNRSIDMAICTHSVGPGTNWVSRCKQGDELHFRWHPGKFVIDDTADQYLFIGDLSALAHLYEIRRNLSPGKKIASIIYGEKKEDFFKDIGNTEPFGYFEMPANPVNLIVNKLPEWTTKSPGGAIAYLGGDSRTCAALFHYLKDDLHWDVKQIRSKPFWNITKRGLE